MPTAANNTTVLHRTLDTDACPVAVYEALYAGKRPTFLYESLQTDGERGRYSFLGGAPLAIAQLRNDTTTLETDGVTQSINTTFADACWCAHANSAQRARKTAQKLGARKNRPDRRSFHRRQIVASIPVRIGIEAGSIAAIRSPASRA